METTKSVKITFHTLLKRMWKRKSEDEIEEFPFWELEDVLEFIYKLPKQERFYDLKGGKFCFIESLTKHIVNEECFLLSGFLKSARSEFRPDLIDKKTGNERKNPKSISEGDIEKTHFVFKFSNIDNELYLFFESNSSGVSVINFVSYITYSTKKYLARKKSKKNFTIIRSEIPSNNFLTELERLSRVCQAEVYFDKQLLGSNALNFSNRTISLKRDIILSARALKKESITEFGVDIWNKMQQQNSPISKLRIKGVDNDGNKTLLDTTLMCRIDFVTVDVNQETGELNSIQLLSGIKNIANSF